MKHGCVQSVALGFGFVVFGGIWILFNAFMPVVFDMSFIAFDPAILNYVWRAGVDILTVTAGVWMAESVGANVGGKWAGKEKIWLHS
jgi:hypothetical protein